MTVDELIDVLKQVKERYGGETKVRLEAYTHDNCNGEVFNADSEVSSTFLQVSGWTYDLNPDKFKVRTEMPRAMRDRFDNNRYLSLGAYTCDGCDHRFNCKHSDLSELAYNKLENDTLKMKLDALRNRYRNRY